eukprot:CAMPEP_0170613840 /NCGR_PEP_ID=MMETSP0224-20130122/24484_1 /TAXON_ID=285029 /ORGANISM="Togula jolla, Strain CCCM 725" /LENGTH=293 /DNA_ID=CAMNT_0010939463 /DNA_START=14 /DNA_END=895 /DNA_ORIENTATION=+
MADSKVKARQVMEQFNRLDVNGDGTVSSAELATMLKKLDSAWTEEKIDRLFAAVDTSSDGKLDVDEFVNWLFGCNVAANLIEEEEEAASGERPQVVLRLKGFSACSSKDLQAVLSSFGPLKHVHHIQIDSPVPQAESMAIFAAESSALAAFAAQLPSEGAKEVELKEGTPLASMVGLSATAMISLTALRCEPDATTAPPEFLATVRSLVGSLKGDESAGCVARVDKVGSEISIADAAKLLRGLSMTMRLRPEAAEKVMCWRRTLRMIARGEVDLMDTNSIVGFVTELQSFLAE